MYKRTWIITGEVTRNDLEWVLRSKLSFMPGEQHYIDINVYGVSRPTKIASRNLEPPTIITTNQKEETWLKLYFADRAVLLAEEVTYKYH